MGSSNSSFDINEKSTLISNEKSTLISNDSYKISKNSRHGKEWDQIEIDEIFNLSSKGISIKILASKYGRSEESIVNKILNEIYLNSINEKISLIKCYDLGIDGNKYLKFVSVKYNKCKFTQSEMYKNYIERK